MSESKYYLRLEEFANNKGYKSINSFAVNALKYKSSEKLNRLKKEGTKPSLDVLLDVSNIFEDFNIHWYVTGEGEMLLSDTKPETTSSETSLASLELDLKRKDFEMKGMLLEFQELKEDVELLKKITSLDEKYIDIVEKKIDESIEKNI
ncbi:hypothetical protein [Tenacibaculum halocynthiae]|uniref:hypothetical protein n=1 Tax=Tenacibaculum halocynthiae TaxID=1254437 RepID=UPI003D65FD91